MPAAIRALLLEWGLEEDPGQQEWLLEGARALADRILEQLAPLEWYWAFFPLDPDGVTVSIAFAADCMEALCELGSVSGWGPYVGRAAHVAHILKSRQGSDGSWPSRVNAYTGQPVEELRCAAEPLLLFARLDLLFDSSEYRAAARSAREWVIRSSAA